MMNSYTPKTPFWTPQQKEAFSLSRDAARFALFMDPRTGKSKVIVDTCCYQHQRPSSPLHVRGLLTIVWPNGAHVGWVKDAWPESATTPWAGFIWNAARSELVSYQREFAAFLKKDTAFRVFAINAESLISESCRRAIGKFLIACNRVMVVVDESSFMSNPTARRSKIMLNISHGEASRFIAMRRILDGTPVDRKGPLDMFAQAGFLGYDVLGYSTYTEYERHYAVMETQGRGPFWGSVKQIEEQMMKAMNGKADRAKVKEAAILQAKGSTVVENGKRRRLVRGRDYWTKVKEVEGEPVFQNMDEFWQRLRPVSYRATFEQCFPNAARPVFAKRYFELTSEQRRVYDELSNEYRSTLIDGSEVSATHHLSRILRLQQVASNYLPGNTNAQLHAACDGEGCEECGETGVVMDISSVRTIDQKANPRADALREELREGLPTIVWTRFVHDADIAMVVASELGMDPVRYDGTMSTQQKMKSRRRFQEERSSGCFVANWAAGSRGIPLHAARKHVAYNNGFSFRTRRQGEERAEHGGKNSATSFVDLVGIDTVDDNLIVPALRRGMSVSRMVMQDKGRAWI